MSCHIEFTLPSKVSMQNNYTFVGPERNWNSIQILFISPCNDKSEIDNIHEFYSQFETSSCLSAGHQKWNWWYPYVFVIWYQIQNIALPLWKSRSATMESTRWQWMDITIYCYKKVIHKLQTGKATKASTKLYALTYDNLLLDDCYLRTRCPSPDSSLQIQMLGELQLTILRLLIGSPSQALSTPSTPQRTLSGTALVLSQWLMRTEMAPLPTLHLPLYLMLSGASPLYRVHPLRSAFLMLFSLIFTCISLVCGFLELLVHSHIMFVTYCIF